MVDMDPRQTRKILASTEVLQTRVEALDNPHAVDINAWIKSLTHTGLISLQSASLVDSSPRVGLFTYLRDRHNVRTYGQALDTLSAGSVDANVVAVWVEEGLLAFSAKETEAVARGYPLLGAEAWERRKKFCDTHPGLRGQGGQPPEFFGRDEL